jgi:hypothetical protein
MSDTPTPVADNVPRTPRTANAKFAATTPVVSQPDVLSPEERAVAREQWRKARCTWCGGLHLRACPKVKRMTFTNDGKNVVEVEYWPDSHWSDSNVVWPEDMKWEEDSRSPFDVVDDKD